MNRSETTLLHVKKLVCKAAKNALKFYPKRIRNELFGDGYKHVTEVCNTAHMKMWREARTDIQASRKAQNGEKLICMSKEEHEGQKLKALQERFRNNAGYKFYEQICGIREGFHSEPF